ncbi:PadR family transcriptional regulator [Actinomadura bangladeshensis]|uniref:PadR family transcriptional regulator n=1 Tax=Actinomadura bangladeshensis TaxID=453573 RepID=A0A6L9Q8Y8_9ACTN|nr:helix-turn-helix transcriptional regulator [Actinomadura bangladeshensis]NEA21949.1 PadR family transcriptional regulator [Actinomadura bangladeshensis]
MKEPRMTEHTQTVLRILLGRLADGERDPAVLQHGLYGLDLSRRSSLPNGTLFPLLERLRKAGWVERYWEADDTAEMEGRPRRRFYKLTSSGAEQAAIELAKVSATNSGNPFIAPRPATSEGSAR